MRKHITVWNFKFLKDKHSEKCRGISQTVPDLNFTLREIIEKFTRGIDPQLSRVGSYEFEGIDHEEKYLDGNEYEFDELTDIDQAKDELLEINSRIKQINEFMKLKADEKLKAEEELKK